MYRIAACDDDGVAISQLKMLISQYALEHSELELSFTPFCSPEELALHIKRHAFDIYLLDIILGKTDGIELGAAIRQEDEKAVIIYITSSPDYAVQSYSVEAFYYLLKPIGRQSLFPVLDKVFTLLYKTQNSAFSIRTRDGLYSVKTSRIVYIEYHSHRLLYHLDDGTNILSITFRESFDRISAPILKNSSFAKVSSSFIVNFMHVKKITKKGFYMTNDMEITVSRLYPDVKREYMDYILKGGEYRAL